MKAQPVSETPVEAITDPEQIRIEVIAIALNLLRAVLTSPYFLGEVDIERLTEAEDLLRRWLGKEPWRRPGDNDSCPNSTVCRFTAGHEGSCEP